MFFYNDPSFNGNDGILKRYKNTNGTDGNSPINTGSNYTAASTLYPDAEDLDGDNNLNQTEQYFQYIVDVKTPGDPNMQVGENFIIDKKTVTASLANGTTRIEIWYHFRIPINSYQSTCWRYS
ncbi:MAG: hypothetical protein WDM71_04535 [Ferruginibacter sp.]